LTIYDLQQDSLIEAYQTFSSTLNVFKENAKGLAAINALLGTSEYLKSNQSRINGVQLDKAPTCKLLVIGETSSGKVSLH
jgi:hypothetical protein